MEVQGEFYFGLRPEIFHKREIFSRWSIITKKHQPFIWYQMRKRICGGVAATRNQFFLPQPASHWTALTPLSIDTALCDPVQQSQCQNFPVFSKISPAIIFCSRLWGATETSVSLNNSSESEVLIQRFSQLCAAWKIPKMGVVLTIKPKIAPGGFDWWRVSNF